MFARRFDSAGRAIGNDFQVNVVTTGHQGNPSAALLANGRFAVVWASQTYITNAEAALVGRMLDSSGLPVGGEFIATPSAVSNQWFAPDVAALPHSEFVVVWSGPSDSLRARRFDAQGSPLGGEFQVAARDMYRPKIAADAAGNFMVVWTALDRTTPTTSTGVFGRRFDRLGVPLGLEFQVNSYTTGFQQEPDVAADAQGNFFVAWREERFFSTFARRFDAAGAPLGPDFQVSSSTPPGTFGPAVTASRTGEILVAWANGTGSPPSGSTWIRGRKYDRSGSPLPEFRADTAAFPFKHYPAVGFDSVGNSVVAWRSEAQDGSRSGVFARRYEGFRPVDMTVDPVAGPASDGNGVLEAGETVAVQPAWRNVTRAASSAFTAAASAFGGPAGPTYSISDGAAAYPAVADDSIARCSAQADCYSMSVAAPSGRPSVHWDGVFTEDLGPGAPSLSQAWRLHVGDSFADVPRTSPFYRFVETLLHHSVTGGCSASAYCPASSTSREQMAVFALVAKEGAGYAPPACGATQMFADVPAGSPFCRWIEELARRGVVGGCGGGNYCPSAPVSREQMAVFALKTLEGPAYVPPACGTPMYSDVPASSPFCRYIEELTRRGVVSGCGNGAYCPQAPVSREQMSVFLGVTFGLLLYGP